MSLLDHLIATIAPHECLGCTAEATLLCADCAAGLPPAVERCYRCHRFSPGSATCRGCLSVSRLHSVRAAYCYQGLAKDMIWKLKLAGARAAAKQMAAQMAAGVTARPDEAAVVPVPTATGRIRRRGYDQAELLARELSLCSRLPYMACLVRTTQSGQHGAGRDMRRQQLARAFRIVRPGRVRGRHVILVDDVITTGATLEAAAAMLGSAGAARVDAVVFAQA